MRLALFRHAREVYGETQHLKVQIASLEQLLERIEREDRQRASQSDCNKTVNQKRLTIESKAKMVNEEMKDELD